MSYEFIIQLMFVVINFCTFEYIIVSLNFYILFSFNKYNLNIVAAFPISWYEQLSCDQKGINEEILQVRF